MAEMQKRMEAALNWFTKRRIRIREKNYNHAEKLVVQRYRQSPKALKVWFAECKAASENGAAASSVICALIINIGWQMLAANASASGFGGVLPADMETEIRAVFTLLSFLLLLLSCLVVAIIYREKRKDRAFVLLLEQIMLDRGYLK